MAMQVILKEDVHNLGKAGELVPSLFELADR